MRQFRREEQIGRGERIGLVGRMGHIACGPAGTLQDGRRVHTELHRLIGGAGHRFFDLLVDRLAPVDALALIGRGFLRARRRLIVLGAVLVHVDLDAPDARLGLGQDGARLEVAEPLLQHLDAIEKRLTLGVGVAGFEPSVDVEHAVGAHRHAGLPGGLEAAELHDDVVGAHGQARKAVVTLIVGRGAELSAVRGVACHDRRADDRTAAGLCHDARHDPQIIGHAHSRHIRRLGLAGL